MKKYAILCCALLATADAYAFWDPWAYDFERIMGTSESCLSFADGSVVNINDPNIELPRNRAVARIGYWGDPGNPEREYAISNTIYSWSGGPVTGLYVDPKLQRGYYDLGQSVGASMLQIACSSGHAEVGALINSYWFTHTQPIFGGGPQVSLGEKRDFPVPIPKFSNGKDLVIQGWFKHPYRHSHEPGALGQIVIGYYMQPLHCPRQAPGSQLCPAATAQNRIPAFAHVIGLFDTRPASPSNTYYEFAAHDGFTAFFSSPAANLDPAGNSLEYATMSPHSAGTLLGDFRWGDYKFYRVHIKYRQMQTMISQAKAMVPDLADASSDPDDWGIVLVTSLLEISNAAAPQCQTGSGAAGCNDIVMGVSMAGIDALVATPKSGYLESAPLPPTPSLPRRRVEPSEDAISHCFTSRRCLGN